MRSRTDGGGRPRVFRDPPVVIGHRGAGSGTREGYLENTVDAVLTAVDLGAAWVEVDVRRTADDALVVLHHPTEPQGAFVSDLTAAQAGALGLLTLEEFFAGVPAAVAVDLDLKTTLEDAPRPPAATTAGLLAPVLRAEAARRSMIVTSFDPAALLQLRRSVPEVPLGLLTWLYFPLRKAVPAAAHLGLDLVAAHVRSFWRNDVDPAPVHRDAAYSVHVAHEAGLEVMAWCPAPDDALRLVDAGVDALVVNDLPGVLTALAERRAGGQRPAR